jgi:hypothetical protein
MSKLERKESKIASFIFHGQIAQTTINDCSILKPLNTDLTFDTIAVKVGHEYFDDKIVESARKMSAVYIAIASYENSVRSLISDRMLEQKGEKWWESEFVSNDIRKRALQKIADEKQNRWHGPRGLSPIYFTELKDLVTIISSNWDIFEDLLGDNDWVRHSIKSLERSRNVIMHSGELSLEDIQRIGIIIRDWFRQVGE